MAWAGGAACELAPPSGAIVTLTFGQSFHSYVFLRNRGTTNSACSSYGLASTSATIIQFGEGQAETSQARQRLGVSCDLLSAYQVA